MNQTSLWLWVGAAGLAISVGCGDGEPGTGTAPASGGIPGAGGATRSGGTAPLTGGTPSTGGAAQGGSQTGGLGGFAGSTGGAAKGGQAVAGGTGGGASGGRGGTAAAGAGGTGESGGAGGVGGAVPGACVASIVAPTDGAHLDQTDDIDGDRCANGLQYDVVVATSAPNGTSVALYAGTSTNAIAQATVSGAQARFTSVTLPVNVTTPLRALVSAATVCEATASVAVACVGVPTCTITAPVLSDTHPSLNCVPVANGGDRVSSLGSPFQAAFEVTTDIADGQIVLLETGSGTTLSATARTGKATFPGVTLAPDGTYQVTATCVGADGVRSTSQTLSYPVDCGGAPLFVFKVKSGNTVSPLVAGDHFDPEDDSSNATAGVQFRICGSTTAADALDLPASLQAAQQNLCVAVGTSTPVCAAAVTGGAGSAGSGNGACVDVGCPGSGAFDLSVTLRDGAGNPTTTTVQGVTCSSSLPQVQFVNPVGDAPLFSEVTKRILAASATVTAQRRDKDAALAGAQYDVVACTNATAGSARLLGGRMGSALTQIGGSVAVAADTSGVCPVGYPSLLRFGDVTLPESLEDSSFALTTATELKVEVTDASSGVGSATIDLWVDSSVPSLLVIQPAGLCGLRQTSSADYTTDVSFRSSVVPVNMTVGSTAYTGTTLSLGNVTITSVTFPIGTSSVIASVEEPSGNVGRIPSPCTVTVGDIPTVTWEKPTATSKLAANLTTGDGVIADANGSAAGWQGTLRVCTSINVTENPGATVQFSTNIDGNLGAAVAIATDGCAEIATATLSEGRPVVITATTSAVGGFQGMASISLPVDVTVPGQPGGLVATIKDRRQTTFHLAWTAPADGSTSTPAGGYEVRVAKTIIDTAEKFAAAERVIYAGSPLAPDAQDGIDVANRIIENDYYFAVRATDAASNLGPIAYTTDASRAAFKTTELISSVTNERMGYRVDGSTDLTGDGRSDLIVGAFNGVNVYLYFGSAEGYSATPSVTITGTATGFGMSAVAIGSVNNDQFPDIAVGSPSDENGKVFIFYGRASWPAAIDQTEANVVIDVDPAATGGAGLAGSYFGRAIARLGDFNGDEIDDFAIGAPYGNSQQGLVAVVFGASGGLPSKVTLPGAYGGNALLFNGNASAKGYFGWNLYGFPGFYDGGSTLVVAAPYETTNGNAYAWSGRTPAAGPLSASSADAALVGSGVGKIGPYSIGAWRGLPGRSKPALGFGVPSAGTGAVRAWSGTATSGPFAELIANIGDSSATAANDFGTYASPGSFSGTTVTTSVIGDKAPDLAVGTKARAGARAYVSIVDGVKLGTLNAELSDISQLADVVVPLPDGWIDFATFVFQIKDLDGDTYGDLAVPEYNWTGLAFNGRIVLLY